MENAHLDPRLRHTVNLLRLTFGILPIVAGLDKFTDFLVNWDHYLNPAIAHMLPFPVHTFMMCVGVIEIIAGIIVLIWPAVGGYIVAAWLALIALTLLINASFLDIAVRDIVMAIAAFSLAKLERVRRHVVREQVVEQKPLPS
jgi:uncharacterized membrane protein YphA (DoxX/SURF4 family)